jgi:hypothetical protein
MNIDQFLGHSSRGRKQKMLGDWKDTPEHSIIVWLHTNASILALWRHNWKRINVWEDRQTRAVTRSVWVDRIVCYEHEENLKVQNFRDKTTGAREYPPVLCPHCKMIEHFRGMVGRSELNWCAPVFGFQGDDPAKHETIHAGGLWNAFGDKNLTAVQKAEMAAVLPKDGGPIYSKNAWKENQKAKLEYAFTVVVDAKPEDGIQITVGPNDLGQKVQEVIAKSMKELGREDGNPAIHPFAIQWEYNPADGVEFGKRYDATRMGKIRLRPAIEKLIRVDEPPSLVQLAEPFNLQTHRANLERHCLVKGIPWDSFFEAARGAAVQVPINIDSGRLTAETPRRDPEQVALVGALSDAAEPEVVDADGNPLFGCDTKDCKGVMRATDTECPACHRSYKVAAAAPPPAPALPKRSEVMARAVEPQPAAPTTSPPVEDDDIPF